MPSESASEHYEGDRKVLMDTFEKATTPLSTG